MTTIRPRRFVQSHICNVNVNWNLQASSKHNNRLRLAIPIESNFEHSPCPLPPDFDIGLLTPSLTTCKLGIGNET